MLDNFFKQYFWVFHVVVVALAGVLVGRTFNIFAGEALRPSAESIADKKPTLKTEAQTDKPSIPTNAFLNRNVMKAEREDLTPPPPEASKTPAEADLDHCDKSTLRVNLVATIVSSNPGNSLAVFVDQGKNEPASYAAGDRLLEEATVKVVEWRRVLVDHNGRCEAFSIENEAEVAKAPEAPAPIADASASGNSDAPSVEIGKNVRRVSDSEYEIPRGEIDNVLGNLNVIATQARIVPSFQNGKANGFKLFAIRPDSLYSKIGVQNGDIVQKINGYEINSPDKALEIYQKLKDAPSITVDLIRRGKTQTLSYNIK